MSADTFARRLEVALRRAGSSQARLAREADLDQSSISRYLRGQCEPNLRQFRAIASALKVPPSFLFADATQIVLAPSGRRDHYYVFRTEKLVGEWIGETENVFHAAEIAAPEAAGALIATIRKTPSAKSGAGKPRSLNPREPRGKSDGDGRRADRRRTRGKGKR